MKKIILVCLYILFSDYCISQLTYESDWPTVGGNSNRTGYSPEFYGSFNGFNRTYNSPNSLWGMPIFTNHQFFATTRYTSLSPLRALIACYNFGNVNPIWTYGSTSGVNLIMGFNNEKIYVRDFQQNGSDVIFALNRINGSVEWTSGFTVERGIIWTAVFADNGDLIVPGSGTKRIMRINHTNGDTVWTNSRIIPNTGAESMCINNNTLYAWEGGLTTPKKIIAIDLNTGVKKYSSVDLPGDGDQEIPMTVSANGVVYCVRDGGLMYAIKDNGTGLNIIWTREAVHPFGTYTQIAVGKDSSVYIPNGKKIFRLNHINGTAMDSSVELVTSGNINPRFASGIFQNLIISNGADIPSEGKFFAFSKDLNTLHWSIPFAYNYYCGPAAGGEFTMPHIFFTGAGTEIKAKYDIIDDINFNQNSVNDYYELNQNFPNPFNPVTKIKFTISENEYVTIKIYDIRGIELATVFNKYSQAGSYEVDYDGSDLSSGIYYYTITAGRFIETKKMNLIK